MNTSRMPGPIAIGLLLSWLVPQAQAQTVYHYQPGLAANPLPAGAQNNAYSAVAAGTDFSLALRTDGTIAAWGSPGNLGSAVPAGLNNVVAIAAGASHGLALRSDGTVAAWGANNAGQTNVPAGLTGVKAIAAGEAHSVAVKNDGAVVAWGSNDMSQLSIPAGLSNVAAIAAGLNHTVALRGDGTMVAWGLNSDGQIPSQPVPNVTRIAAGRLHTVVLTRDHVIGSTAMKGQVLVFGRKAEGQAPATAIYASEVKSVSAGPYSTLVVMNTGALRICGQIPAGMLVPSDVISASMGANHLLAIRPHEWNGLTISRWTPLPGSVSQVAIHSQGREQADLNRARTDAGDLTYLNFKEEAWAIGTADNGGGNRNILRYDKTVAGGQWVTVPGQATRIADGPDGSEIKPWVLTAQMGIWKRDAAAGWLQVPGGASDIATGGNGSHFVVGYADTTQDNVWKLEGSGWSLVPGLSARRIAVEPDGTLWAVGRDYSPYRIENGAWVKKPGSVTSIGISYTGAVWATDNTPAPGPNNTSNFGVLRWMGDRWQKETGTAVSLAAGSAPNPYAILSDGTFWVANVQAKQ